MLVTLNDALVTCPTPRVILLVGNKMRINILYVSYCHFNVSSPLALLLLRYLHFVAAGDFEDKDKDDGNNTIITMQLLLLHMTRGG